MVDGRHAFAQAERFEDALGLEGQADAGAHERYPEVWHCVCGWDRRRGGRGFGAFATEGTGLESFSIDG